MGRGRLPGRARCAARPQRFSSASGVGLANLLTDEYGWRKPSLILEVDPPVHTAHRALMVSTMNPKAMRAFQELFEAEAATLADELVRRGRFDAIRDLAEIFPTVAAAPPEAGLGGPGTSRDPVPGDTERPPTRAAATGHPDTILRWHRDIVRRRWAAQTMRAKTGQPATRGDPAGLE